jgi:hypothetical protein
MFRQKDAYVPINAAFMKLNGVAGKNGDKCVKLHMVVGMILYSLIPINQQGYRNTTKTGHGFFLRTVHPVDPSII